MKYIVHNVKTFDSEPSLELNEVDQLCMLLNSIDDEQEEDRQLYVLE